MESNLHMHLIEIINSEIVLQTIRNIDEMMKWFCSTFLYIRIKINPKYYGFIEMECIDDKIKGKTKENKSSQINFDLATECILSRESSENMKIVKIIMCAVRQLNRN